MLLENKIAAALAGVLLASLPTLYHRAVERLLRRGMSRVKAGEPEAMLAAYVDDVRFVFPGDSSWSGDFRGREEVERWVRRFLQAGLQLDPHEILVSGPPWDTKVCVRFTDRAEAPDGSVVYENYGVMFAKIVWGKVVYYEVNEDTQKVAAFDEWLDSRESVDKKGGVSEGRL